MKKDKAYSIGLDVHDLDKQQIEEKCQHFIEKLKLHCEPCGLESVLQAFEELIFHLREIRLNVVFKSLNKSRFDMIEIPDFFDVAIQNKGYNLVDVYYNSISGKIDRYLIAKKIVETFSGEDLVMYLAQILYGIEVLKNK